jgi:hemerythrin-like metal-binding protein
MMTPMDTWTAYPEVGMPEIDIEHEALGAAVLDMLEAMTDDDRERTCVLARELANDVAKHFAHEEALMREIGYCDTARHAATHEEFLDDAALHLEMMQTRGLTADVLRWAAKLDEWFHRHVTTEDMWLARAVNRVRPEPPATSPG